MNESNSIQDLRPMMYIAGHAHKDWLNYTINSGFFTPADGWSVRLGLGKNTTIPSWFKLWEEVELFFDGIKAFTGRIDQIRHNVSPKGHHIELSGRDKAAILLDCSAPVFSKQVVTLPEIIAAIVRPLGIEDIKVVPGKKVMLQKMAITPGVTAWEVLKEASCRNGLWPWFDPHGQLIIGRPDYSKAVVGQITLRHSGVENTLLELTVEKNIARQYSSVVVLSQTQGSGLGKVLGQLQSVALDTSVPFRPRIMRKGYTDNPFFMENVAQSQIEEGKLKGIVLSAKVQGHMVRPGLLWEPGQRVHVLSEPHGLDKVFFVTSRTFSGGRAGTFTTLTLHQDKLWLA